MPRDPKRLREKPCKFAQQSWRGGDGFAELIEAPSEALEVVACGGLARRFGNGINDHSKARGPDRCEVCADVD